MFIKKIYSLLLVLLISSCAYLGNQTLTQNASQLNLENGTAFWESKLDRKLAANQETIVIYNMNDLHGSINNFPKIATILKSARLKTPNVLFLVAGDIFSGNAVVDQIKERGKPMIDLLNEVGTTAITLGNHDFDYGQEILAKRINEMKFPVINANIFDQKTGKNPFVNLKTFTNQQTKTSIAITGVIDRREATGLPATNPPNFVGLIDKDPKEVIKSIIPVLRKNNVAILISHMGYEEDVRFAEEQAMKGKLDVIVGGHSHTVINRLDVHNDIVITQAGGKGRSIGETVLTLENGKIVNRQYRLIDMDSVSQPIPQDSKIQKMVNDFNNTPELNVKIGTNKTEITSKIEMGDMIATAVSAMFESQLKKQNTQSIPVIAFKNMGGIRSGTMPVGPITLKTIFNIIPIDDEVLLFQLTAKQVRDLIAYSVIKARGEIDLVTGGDFTYESTAGQSPIVKIKFKGQSVDDSQKFIVALDSYIANSYFQKVQSLSNVLQTGKNTFKNSNDVIIEFIKLLDKKGIALDFGGKPSHQLVH